VLLLGGRDLLLFPTLCVVRLDRASDRTHSAGVQNCRDRLVIATRSDEESKIAQTGFGQYECNGNFSPTHKRFLVSGLPMNTLHVQSQVWKALD
jgi:hypothetical protein